MRSIEQAASSKNEPSDLNEQPEKVGSGGQDKHWTETIVMLIQFPSQRPRLLTLPQEIVNLILTFVIGGSVVHVDDAELASNDYDANCQHPPHCHVCQGPAFYLMRCCAEVSEGEALKEYHTEVSSVPVDDDLRCSGHGLPRPAAGSYATHWTQATQVQRPPQASGLLRLPAEILDHILGYVVGHKVLHIDDAESVEEEHLKVCDRHPAICEIGQGHGPRFYLRVCAARVSEQTAWEQFTSAYEEVPDRDDEEYYVADGKDRHNRCRDWGDVTLDCTEKSALFNYPDRLTVFRVCSQLSLPAFKIFWATNTFSFGTTPSFRKLLSSLNDTQKGAIRNINFNFDTAPERMDFDPCQLIKLQTLDTLNLCLHSTLLGSVSEMEEEKPDVSQIDLRKQPVNDILRLEVLDIRRLNVIVYDNEYDYFESPGPDQFDLRFTVGEKQYLADVVQRVLMAPRQDREVLAREDRQIFELEELVKGLRFAQDVRWQVQRRNLTP
ncbi:MAG: hypothetical protein Q9188_004073 [Gyalolechia gomerana]